MVIVLKNRAAIYQREAAEMLHNISLYPGLTEGQLCRFFPEKEVTAKTLLAHMLKEERIFCAENGRYYANQEAQNGADKDLSRCVWVLLDFINQVEYHTVGEFPAAILCFANGELYSVGSHAAALCLRLLDAVHRQLCRLAEKRRYAGRYFSAVPLFVAAGLFQRYSMVSLQPVLYGRLCSNICRNFPVPKAVQPRCLNGF